ncbi:hypothetical protein GJ496_003831 [Pomphorhynchus laevis]|nr:hypothetical protein GJ496_003831 [Pomphorhynchus laevis]
MSNDVRQNSSNDLNEPFTNYIAVNFKTNLNSNHFKADCPTIVQGKFNHGIPTKNYREWINNQSDSNPEYLFAMTSVKGSWYPNDCIPVHDSIAVILPIRGRPQQLQIYLSRIHPFLQQQKIPYVIITVNQTGKEPFNRGILFNIGVLHTPQDINCFILSDVDMIPDLYENMFTCNKTYPKHISSAISRYNYKLNYPTNFGGIVAFTRDQFVKVNGFSNRYWGWGGEDDDLYRRTRKFFKTITRVPPHIGRITHMDHYKNESGELNENRFNLLKQDYSYLLDGLNNTMSICKICKINYYSSRTSIDISCKQPQ